MTAPKDPEKYAAWIEKLRQAHTGKPSGMLGKHHDKDSIERIRQSNIGKHNFKHKEESIQKISEAGKLRKGLPSPFKGKTYEEIGRAPSPLTGKERLPEHREAISKGHLKRLGQTECVDTRDGGLTSKWKLAVKKRDNYTCQSCGIKHDELERKKNDVTSWLHAHHIKSWREFPDLRFEVTNGITLCWQCHLKAENKKISIPDSMPEVIKKPKNKGKHTGVSPLTGKSEEEIKEFKLQCKLVNLLIQSLGARKNKGGRPKGLQASNKGKSLIEQFGEEKAASIRKKLRESHLTNPGI